MREHLGPLIADSTATAIALAGACLAANPERRFLIDVPDFHDAWRAALHDTGFTVERPFLRMRRGTTGVADDPASIYAIAGPEFG